MTLIHLLGDVGAGKTLFATKLALHEKRPVYSNYKIRIKNYRPLKLEMLTKLKSSSLCIFDEAYRWLESRMPGRNVNRYLSYILFQSRKRGLDIVLTDQLESSIDLRYREMTNYEVLCEVIDIGFSYKICKLSRYRTYRPVTYVMPFEYAEKVLYPKFDSWEFLPIDEELVFEVSEDKSSSIKEIDRIVSRLLKQADAKAYTQGIVDDYCIRHAYPKQYSKMVYNAIQASQLGIRKKK